MKTDDWRNIRHGLRIPTETYSDQPYIVTTDDGAWLCVVTTGAGHEGQGGQHVITMRSTDRGQTWSTPVDVEPASGPEASYAVLLKVPEGNRAAGRIFVFYNHNTDNVREVLADQPAYPDGVCRRVDSLGHFVYRFSDDGGRTWSAERYDVPMRTMEIDRQNPYGGELKFFWNVGKPFVHAGRAYVPLHKVGGFGEGFFTRSEGVLLHSPNLLSADDPGAIVWETLPEGEIGLRTPPGGGPIAEEQSYVVLSDGSFYVVYRTIDGHPVEAYSRDGGRTWTEPRYMTYADGRPIKHPRAANFVWRCANGYYLYWFGHGGRFSRSPPSAFHSLRTAIPSGSAAVSGRMLPRKGIRWSQPDIVLYDDDPYVRMSYPGLVEDGDRVFLTETQKNVARVHEIPAAFLDALWNRDETRGPETDGLILTYQPLPPLEVEASQSCALGGTGIPMPALPPFLERNVDSADYGTRDLRAGSASTSPAPTAPCARRYCPGQSHANRTGLLPSDSIPADRGDRAQRWSHREPVGLRSRTTHRRAVAPHRRDRRWGPKDHHLHHRRRSERWRRRATVRLGALQPLRSVNGAEQLHWSILTRQGRCRPPLRPGAAHVRGSGDGRTWRRWV